MTQTMRAIVFDTPGDAAVLQLREVPRPEPRPDELLIRVRAAGVNRPDILQRRGLYRAPADASAILGLEVAGEVVAGQGNGLSVGDPVCALVHGGGYAEYVCAPAQHCLPRPQGLSWTQAAALPETCFTVWSNVFERGQLRAGETLLVHGGSSGIGTTAIQIARARGARVFTTVGNADKARACQALGAEQAWQYKDCDFVREVRVATGGRGVDVILDMVGGAYLPRNIECLADDGRLVQIGLLDSARATLPLWPVMMRRLTITGSTLRPRSVEYKAQLARALIETVWPLIEAGQFAPVMAASFELARAAQAHQLMESNAHIGKIVLTLP